MSDSFAAPSLDGNFPSAAFRRLMEEIEILARDPDSTIVLEGETGTGKTLVAQEIHRRSARANAPFRRIDLGLGNDTLLSSEMFGHKRGAFTDAKVDRRGVLNAAAGGTVLFDEFQRASAAAQGQIMWLVEYREFRALGQDDNTTANVRVILAVNKPLAKMIEDGELPHDLMARLKFFVLPVPALRDRAADIPMLVSGIVKQYASRYGYAAPPDVDPALMAALRHAPWPYNIRELDRAVKRIMLNANARNPLALHSCTGELAFLNEQPTRPVSDAEIRRVVHDEGSVTRAAKRLGMHRTTVHRHLRHPDDDNAPPPEV